MPAPAPVSELAKPKPPLLDQPEFARVLPFAVYLAIPALGGGWLPQHEYWLYAVKVVVVAGLVLWLRRRLPEVKWSFSWVAVGVGIGVAVVWELISHQVPGLGRISELAKHAWSGQPLPPTAPVDGWTPLKAFPNLPVVAYGLVGIRVLGRSWLVPIIEETFYRSFVYRYLIDPRFETVPLTHRHLVAWLTTSAVFGLSHPDQWLAGCLCGAAYQWLVVRSGRLGDAMLAHAITNGLLSGWVIWRGTWDFS
jgi:hypothetical protein